MNVNKVLSDSLWYEDEKGNKIPNTDECKNPDGAKYQISRFPNVLHTTHLVLISQEEVDKCRHKRKHVIPTYGWKEGYVGRKCMMCHGTQVKKKFHLWPRKWEGSGSRVLMEGTSSWNEELVMAIVKSGAYTLNEAILISALSCERCMNALAHMFGLSWGYPEYGDEWKKCNTECDMCREGQ